MTALKQEALSAIKLFGLKKINNEIKIKNSSTFLPGFGLYQRGDIALAVGGVGLKTCASFGYCMARFNVDFLINIGICAAVSSTASTSDIFMPKTAINSYTKQKFELGFVDLGLKNANLYSFLTAQSQDLDFQDLSSKALDEQSQDLTHLIDMELAFLAEVAVNFMPLKNIYSLKIISDFLNPSALNKNMVQNLSHRLDKPLEKLVKILKEKK